MSPDAVLEEWTNRSGEYSPTYYAYHGPDEVSEAVRRQVDRVVGPEGSVIELGCSAGRHLAHLHDHGYRDLHGVDINAATADVMAETYPDLAATGTFHWDAIENVIEEFEDDRFDALFTVETLQQLHPDSEWVYDEIARIAGDLLVTVEIEEDFEADPGEDPSVKYVNGEFPLYYRNWNEVFTDRGFEEVAAVSLGRDTLRAFRPEVR